MKMKWMFLALPVLFGCGVFAQSSIPRGTILPARLNSSLNSRKIRPGQRITARIMQDVPLPSGRKIPSGSKLAGQILSVETGGPSQSAKINFRLDQLHFSHHSVGISAHLRALASVMEVEDAQTPPTGPDRGTPWVWATRKLIGGEVAYGTGPVARGTEIVGEGVIDGVLVPARANPDRGCRGEAGNTALQAFWVFSSDACGVYGLGDLQISHAGRTPPVGEVMLSSTTGRLNVRAGSGLLLRVNSVAEQ